MTKLKSGVANYLSQNTEPINFSYKDILTATEKTRATIYTIIPGMRFVGIPEDERMKRTLLELENSERAFAEMQKITYTPSSMKGIKKDLKARTESFYQQQLAITELAKFTGGWTGYLEQPEQADKIYSGILSGINRRYVIGYYPTNQESDGKRRKVKTEVNGHPEYKILGRKTYILR